MTDARVGSSVDRALDVLRAGGLVGLPTETVYGLAADAASETAVRRVFAAKGRPADHPLIVHVASADELAHWAAEVPPAAAALAATCWPGPLTLLVRRAPHVLDVVTGGRPTVGVRVPAHPLALEVLERFGGGLAAPSANLFGRVSPTTAAHVAADLGDRVDYVLDGGPCPVGVESTIVDCTVEPPQILRHGAISDAEVASIVGDVAPATGPARAPGMLASHYAPTARVLLADDRPGAEELLGRHPGARLLDRTDDLAVYARTLYAELRRADADGVEVLVAVLPAARGIGHAIRDRLTRAAR